MDEDELMSAFRLLSEDSSFESLIDLVQRIRAIMQSIEYTLSIRTPDRNKWYINLKGTSLEFDLAQHIENTSSELNKLLSINAATPLSLQIQTGHSKLSQLLEKYKNMVTEETKSQILFVEAKSIPYSRSKTLRVSQELPDSNDAGKQSELREELEDEIYNVSLQLKRTAQEINRQLNKDKEVPKIPYFELIHTIEKRQDKGLSSVQSGKSRIDRLLSSKSLSCTTLFLMLFISIFLFVFGLIFIRLF